MDLNSYADLAVRLVNSTNQGCGDGLATVESYRALVADRQHLAGRVTVSDLDALRLLREELQLIFAAADSGDAAQVAERLNALLTRHPIHQELISHDSQQWHMHLVESGSAADRHAAGAIAGLTGLVTVSGHRPVRDLRSGRLRAGIYRDRYFRGKALLLRRMQAQGESAGFAGPRARQRPGAAVHRRELRAASAAVAP